MTYASLAEALERPGRGPEVVRFCIDVLEEVLAGRRPIIAVRHPLGFVCLPVIRDGDTGVCVHLWDASLGPPPTTTSVAHSHSWDLLSYVLFGEIGNVLLSVEDSDLDATHRIFEIHSADGVDEVRQTPRLVRCHDDHQEIVRSGQRYRLSAGRFHRSFIVGADAATLVLARTTPMVDLSLGSPHTKTHLITRQLCTREETWRSARTVLSRLSG